MAEDCALAIAEAGADELVIHARTKAQAYRPPAHWQRIAEVVSVLRPRHTLPVVANGEIWSVADAERCRRESGCDALMIGRGLVTDPGLALAIQGGRAVPWAEVEALLPLFWQQVRARVQPRHRAGRLKQWLNYLRHRYPEAQAAFDALRVGNDPARVEAWLASLPTVAQARPSEVVTAECA